MAAAESSFHAKIFWPNVVVFAALHLGGVYGFWLLTSEAKWPTVHWTIFLHVFAGFGVTGGLHRLWSHRSYKATQPLKVLLIIMSSVAFEEDIIEWCLNHRCHHKYTETDADPHDSRRGFFFSHVGWLLCEKHPDVMAKRKLINVSDLETDPLLVFQRKYYMLIAIPLCFILPTIVPLVWGESLLVSFFGVTLLRLVLTLNASWAVNSFAHLYGTKPYRKTIEARQSFVANLFTIGEGWHNYHHSLPMDYRASEYGCRFNLTSALIDMFAFMGLAYDLQTSDSQLVRAMREKHGEEYTGEWPYFFG